MLLLPYRIPLTGRSKSRLLKRRRILMLFILSRHCHAYIKTCVIFIQNKISRSVKHYLAPLNVVLTAYIMKTTLAVTEPSHKGSTNEYIIIGMYAVC